MPRHLFVPGADVERAYRDEAIPTKLLDGGTVSSASQPSIVAVMLEQLGVKLGQQILEVGAGTGYNAALLAQLAGPSGRVVTIDIDDDIVEGARAHLATAGIEGVEAVCGDGGFGYAAEAPYDRIVVTAGAWDIAPAWWEQLAPGGRLVVPLSLRGVQRCVALERRGGWMESISVRDCGFMRLRGAFHGPETIVATGSVTVTFDSETDTADLSEILTRHTAQRGLDPTLSADETFGGLALWLALNDPSYCTLEAAWRKDETPPIPVAATFPSGELMIGWSPATFDGSSLAVLGRQGHQLVVHAFGDDPDAAERLANTVMAWVAAGRPGSESLMLRVRPMSEPNHDTERLIEIQKQWTTLIVQWPDTSAQRTEA